MAAAAQAYTRITTIRATNEDVLEMDDFSNYFKPMKVGVSFNPYTGLVVQNWSGRKQYANLYHVIECTNPASVQAGIQSIAPGTEDQATTQAAGTLLLEKTPVYGACLDISESFTFGDEPEYYIEVVMSENQDGGAHGKIKKTGRLQTMAPGKNALLYTVFQGSVKISVDLNPQIPVDKITVNNSLRLISVRNGSAEGIPVGMTMYLYIKEVGGTNRTLHCLQFTNSIREGVFNVTKDYLVEILNASDQVAGSQGSFVDQLITFNQGIAILATPSSGTAQVENAGGNFQLLLLNDLYKQAKLLYPTDTYNPIK